ncbi:hypothetical protein D3875_17150 [Deinococcus cavernae]|uniref:Uncharacterized protein n=1 Tax=Deinococcus cavernae TaxID=2320857 RepID=A0A418VA90_9DEIO|nr:DUF6714 family protein [Deinococcus cavernae]RJF73010.1 hypothetical protein D3875_17150 [Deinococcus cavernae]
MDFRAQATLDQLRQAFEMVQLGSGVSLHEANVIDDYGTAEQRLAARALDTEQHWWEVPDEAIALGWGYCALSFMDARGLHYYLPAYASWVLRRGFQSDSAAFEHTIYTLESVQERPGQFVLFNFSQAQAIQAFLQYLLSVDPDDSCFTHHYQRAHAIWTAHAETLKEYTHD